ncbi:MAG TPA: GDP-mannose 4,6-dehydratase [Gemmatimonadales bacterium]|nr:GDP-mannose 4,6-dehydratase [Gemmatimonadales bacterium]
MRVLVTGADGFVGRWLVSRLLEAGHEVGGTHRSGGGPSPLLAPEQRRRVAWRPLELASRESVEQAVAGEWSAVVHLAALASGTEARQDPGLAWEVTAAGTARLAEALGRRAAEGDRGPLLLLVSTAEVYGAGSGAAHREGDPVAPCSPYAASKLGAEVAVFEVRRRTGLRVIVARPFAHTGPGQDARFVIPALASRLRTAKRVRAPAINAGNLDAVRDLLDVRDVVEAYLALLESGVVGETYNIASGEGHSLRDVLDRLQELVGWRVIVEYDSGLARRADILHLVGDAGKLHAATGWAPRIPLDQTLQDLLDAQAV